MRGRKKSGDIAPEKKQNDQMPELDDFKGAKRNMTGGVLIHVDTFKLESELMAKNVGYNERIMIESFDHCHIFHTYDSNGKKNKGCNQVGGHYHEVEIYVDDDGMLRGKCSPPIQNKKSEKIVSKDRHVHEVTYIKSEKVEVRKMNPVAQQYAANFMKSNLSVSNDDKMIKDVER